MRVYRTPDDRFADLPDWPYAPNYAEIADSLRVHYVDEGASDAQPVLMLHGEPTWSYLYRHMIGPTVEAGFRVAAPDLIGFGRSDKPLDRASYSYAAQVAWMRQWIEILDLKNIILACQDWGSLIGLRLVAEMPERFAGVALSNGGLPEGQPAPRAFAIWRAFGNNYWPAHYFVDARGRIRFHHFGEGEYEKSERVIQQLLEEARKEAKPA